MLRAEKITGGYGQRAVVQDISFRVDGGEMLGIIGPNGSGKSTLLQLCTGALPLMDGEVWLCGQRLHTYKDKERARLLAVVTQQAYVYFSYTVREFVALGRYPYTRRWLSVFSEADEEAIAQAMAEMDVFRFRDQPLQMLSGGERQRVFLARALAQRPAVILLDEPTNHLDIAYQMKFLDALKKWIDGKGGAVGIIFHDLNLAALYCDRLLLLGEGERKACGEPEQVLTEERIQTQYGARVSAVKHPVMPKRQLLHSPGILTEKQPGRNPRVWVEENAVVIEFPESFNVFSGQTFTWKKQLNVCIPGEAFDPKASGPLIIDRSFDWQPAAGVRLKCIEDDNGERIIVGAALHANRKADVFVILFAKRRDDALADLLIGLTKQLAVFLHPDLELGDISIGSHPQGAEWNTQSVHPFVSAELQKLLKEIKENEA
ncbi:ABC transporter ATP-binding protein [Salicibibacter cibarius]|uniref:ABC transporter ATP-binding protein n=1 Tax=Salicibibacter cibarius TaxID=2743000 RepID=A0A7T7CBM2_9BACI|nr:ABC transporter ATP-binding protein [Salicibibacter cibarius]QQK75979.1 ABC transporter ATP-binding protein [Salicibibacter cibarius]